MSQSMGAAMTPTKLYLTNSFSLNMLSPSYHVYEFQVIHASEAAILLYALQANLVNAIGHAETHTLVEQTLRKYIRELHLPEPQRLTIRLAPGDELLVAQYTGPRLPEGATTLPQGARLEFWMVSAYQTARGKIVEQVIESYQRNNNLQLYDRLRAAADIQVRAVEMLEAVRWLARNWLSLE
jgi:hypothetical protein